jgi:predicted secreted hydrolase
LTDTKPAALHHGGYLDYGAPGGSYYYSRTRLLAEGQLNGEPVSGIAWMDHQWGDFVVAAALTWDWFSLQLDDQTELMLYVLRDPTGAAVALYGTQVLADGQTRDLDADHATVTATGSWTSPHTGGVYPAGWEIVLADGQRLEVRPSLADQELWFPELAGQVDGVVTQPYWEGAVSVTGDRRGVGYVELTGYAGR